MVRPSLFLSATAIFLLSPLAPGKTWYVGSGGGADFNEIQPAIDAASDGDLIFVRPEKTYLGFTLADKSLTIRSTSGQFVVSPTVRILGLSQTRSVHLGAMKSSSGHAIMLSITECAGEVGVDDVLRSFDYALSCSPMAEVINCANVHLTGLQVLQGGDLMTGGVAMNIFGSIVQLTDAVITGLD